ncbi:MAG TPA: family 43 glycosylhydrolase [Bacteroidales bacterium]|nr:family 43 glycosylhydrolase [Bacteroidales bacterium]HPI68309.1 family 43 glycosylhydrolase [Bacteroidales bacterium]HPR72859.1 family 43 glycosylhydrolase [Bacteroidales bacterium]
MKTKRQLILLALFSLLFSGIVSAQNPLIRDQFTADPTARVFNGKVYLFPSHDIPAPEAFARKDWFCMEDYHVFSSPDLVNWTDHGVIVSQYDADWVDTTTFSMWAPDCIERDGKYYFYFPANVRKGAGRGFGIGVAVADNPEGPYTPQPEPIKGIVGIDPSVFIDKDGQAYIYYSMNRIFGAKLKDNMLELDSEPRVLENFPTKGLVEGPFFFERNGIYYMTYPHVQNNTERLEYAIGDNPMGPFKFAGVIMDESASGCWTNHHSIIEFNDQWYLFYHDKDLSPDFDKNRSAKADSLFFNEDGTMRKVIPTLRGVGVSSALQNIEIDRYSKISESGASVAFLDTANTFKGWKTRFDKQNAWISYNKVDFGKKKLKTIRVKAISPSGGTLQIRLNNPEGLLLAEVKIPAGTEWDTINKRLSKYQKGIHDLVVVLKDSNPVEVDWIRFE